MFVIDTFQSKLLIQKSDIISSKKSFITFFFVLNFGQILHTFNSNFDTVPNHCWPISVKGSKLAFFVVL